MISCQHNINMFSEICPILHVEQQHDTWIHKIIWLHWNNLSCNTARQKIHIALSLNIQQGIVWCKQIQTEIKFIDQSDNWSELFS